MAGARVHRLARLLSRFWMDAGWAGFPSDRRERLQFAVGFGNGDVYSSTAATTQYNHRPLVAENPDFAGVCFENRHCRA